jgi:uncharacterized membrane protein YphA (DoxX/SURF4 family)
MRIRSSTPAALWARIALSVTFLESVMDRFGVLGPRGQHGVAWGDFAHFSAYVARLNWFLPAALIPSVAWVTTILEATFGVCLLLGLWTRPIAGLSAGLLILFALAMTFAIGPKAALDYSVWSASSAAFLLMRHPASPFSLDPERHDEATVDAATNVW